MKAFLLFWSRSAFFDLTFSFHIKTKTAAILQDSEVPSINFAYVQESFGVSLSILPGVENDIGVNTQYVSSRAFRDLAKTKKCMIDRGPFPTLVRVRVRRYGRE